MRLFVHLATRKLIFAADDTTVVESWREKFRTEPTYEIQFIGDSGPELLAGGTEVHFTLKEEGKYDGDAIVFEDGFIAPGDASGYYTAAVNYNTTALETLLAAGDSNDDNDVSEKRLMGEISWFTAGNPSERSATFTVFVDNAVDSGSEVAPSEAGLGLDTRVAALEDTLDGNVLPKFSAIKGSSQVVSGSTATKVEFTSVEYDIGGGGNGFDNANDRYICNTLGRYRLLGYIKFLGILDATNVTLEIYKNGLFYKEVGSFHADAEHDYSLSFSVDVVALGEVDYFELFVTHDNAESQTVGTGYFQGSLLV